MRKLLASNFILLITSPSKSTIPDERNSGNFMISSLWTTFTVMGVSSFAVVTCGIGEETESGPLAGVVSWQDCSIGNDSIFCFLALGSDSCSEVKQSILFKQTAKLEVKPTLRAPGAKGYSFILKQVKSLQELKFGDINASPTTPCPFLIGKYVQSFWKEETLLPNTYDPFLVVIMTLSVWIPSELGNQGFRLSMSPEELQVSTGGAGVRVGEFWFGGQEIEELGDGKAALSINCWGRPTGRLEMSERVREQPFLFPMLRLRLSREKQRRRGEMKSAMEVSTSTKKVSSKPPFRPAKDDTKPLLQDPILSVCELSWDHRDASDNVWLAGTKASGNPSGKRSKGCVPDCPLKAIASEYPKALATGTATAFPTSPKHKPVDIAPQPEYKSRRVFSNARPLLSAVSFSQDIVESDSLTASAVISE
nr:uncharacterized protein LOC105790100 isoform X2 [Ipomoea batatas]